MKPHKPANEQQGKDDKDKKDAEHRCFFGIGIGHMIEHQQRQSTRLVHREKNDRWDISDGGNKNNDGDRDMVGFNIGRRMRRK